MWNVEALPQSVPAPSNPASEERMTGQLQRRYPSISQLFAERQKSCERIPALAREA